MPKTIHQNIAVLSILSTLSACAGLPVIGARDASEPAKSIASDSPPFVDYWQTRDPSEYRRPLATPRPNDRKPVPSSQDVVFSGKDKIPGKAGNRSESRISLIIPVQPDKTVRASEQKSREPEKTRTVAAGAKPVAALKIEQKPAVFNQKGKRKPTGVAGNNLWNRVRGGLRLTDVEHARIDEQIEYLKRNPGYVNLFSQRARPFLHYLVENVDRRDLPMDLVLVPMVESAFEPTAVSPKEAAGLWQIIPATGQERGLLIAEGYDGRFDIHASTEAALGYLRYLNKLFQGDWLLALAAYNAGPGAVREALESSKQPQPPAISRAKNTPPSRPMAQTASTTVRPPSAPLATLPPLPATETASLDESTVASLEARPQSPYWLLKLPKETQDYVPRILALSRIVANPEQYGFQLAPINNGPYLFRVDVAPEVKILDALVATNISTDEFFRFNPGFKPGVEPPLRAYKLLLPLGQGRDLAAKVPGVRLVAANQYTVKKGETLAAIAKRHGVPSQELAQWNRLSVDSVLKAGQRLIVYPAS